MAYVLKTSRSFQKDFGRLNSMVQTRVLIALETMKMNPFFNAKKLVNASVGIFRMRIGDYRLRFDVVGQDIYLYRIRHRKEVYKG